MNLKPLSRKNTQKVNKQNIQDSQNWVLDELNEIDVMNFNEQMAPDVWAIFEIIGHNS